MPALNLPRFSHQKRQWVRLTIKSDDFVKRLGLYLCVVFVRLTIIVRVPPLLFDIAPAKS